MTTVALLWGAANLCALALLFGASRASYSSTTTGAPPPVSRRPLGPHEAAFTQAAALVRGSRLQGQRERIQSGARRWGQSTTPMITGHPDAIIDQLLGTDHRRSQR